MSVTISSTEEKNGGGGGKKIPDVILKPEVVKEKMEISQKSLTDEIGDGGDNKRKCSRNLILNLILNLKFQYVVVGLCGLMTLLYTAGSIGGGFSKEWEMMAMYKVGLIYMLFISGLMWLNTGTKWLLLFFHIGHPRTNGKCQGSGFILLIGFYFLVTLLLIIVYGTAIILPLVKYDSPTYEQFHPEINFVLPLCFHFIMELLFGYYWIVKGNLCGPSIPIFVNPYY